MAIRPVPPAPKIIAITGDAITVQLRPVQGVANEVVLHLTRNGAREERFTLAELQAVLAVIQAEAAKALVHQLNAPQ